MKELDQSHWIFPAFPLHFPSPASEQISMKTILFAVIFLSACTTPQKPELSQKPKATGERLIARFEPSIPPPPSAELNQTRSISSVGALKKSLSDGEIQKLWSQVNDRKDSLIRSNPSHYWAWMAAHLPDDLKAIASHHGQIVADAHYFNFSDVHGKDKSGLALVDVDDSGVGSLYLDFVRYAIFVKAYMKIDLTAELFDAYKDGLQKKEKTVPPFLSNAISKNRKDLELEHQEWVSKNLKTDYKLNNENLEIESLKKIPEKSIVGNHLAELLVRTGKAKKVYDIGYSTKNSGSSRGMDRYWFSLITAKGDSSIYECKQLGTPASAYYAVQQALPSQRIADVLKVYSDVETNDSFVFPAANASYWCRQEHFDFFSRKIVEAKRRELKPMTEYSRYLAYWMGLKQSSQPEGDALLQTLEADKKKLLDDTIDLIISYEDEVFKLGKK